LDALADTPVVFLDGARQTGKSTLVRHIGQARTHAPYFTMDDLSILSAAQNDPQGFVAGLPEKVRFSFQRMFLHKVSIISNIISIRKRYKPPLSNFLIFLNRLYQ
jgi:predicted AAA+ superfamily ATPase